MAAGMRSKTAARPLLDFVLLLCMVGCSSQGDERPQPEGAGSGGAPSTSEASGGANSGGTASGGAVHTGGQPFGSGGELSSGGAFEASGGLASTGGSSETGGTPGVGGTVDVVDIHAVAPSSGCGTEAFATEGSWVNQPDIDIDGQPRSWAVRFPDNYNPQRAYPIIFEFHGCGSKTNNVPMENVAGSDAIHVRGASIGSCWHDLATGEVNDDTESVDLPFFDAMLGAMKENACIDENRIFGVGYSSGAWLITIMACKRADTFRAVGTVAGADWVHMNGLGPPSCSEGNVAQMYISDTDDTGSNRWENHVSAQDRLVEANGCTPESETPIDPSPCVRFQDCGDFPVQRCRTSGSGHGRQDGYAPGAFWSFFSEFLADN